MTQTLATYFRIGLLHLVMKLSELAVASEHRPRVVTDRNLVRKQQPRVEFIVLGLKSSAFQRVVFTDQLIILLVVLLKAVFFMLVWFSQ